MANRPPRSASVLTDDKPERLPAEVRELGGRAFALLAEGLGTYTPKPAD